MRKEDYQETNIVDFIKLFCCILIIGSHTLPLFNLDIINYYYGQ